MPKARPASASFAVADPSIAVLQSSRLACVVEQVEEHLEERITLHDLAAWAHLDLFYFARLFKQTTGVTPHQYVLSRRMARVIDLLKQLDLSLCMVAIESGFSSQSHMTEMFRRKFGTTPHSYRAKCCRKCG
jgi:AraC family transcriptional regulator